MENSCHLTKPQEIMIAYVKAEGIGFWGSQLGRWGNKLGGEKRWTFCKSGRVVTEYVQQANTLKINNRNTRKRYKIFSKLTTKTPDRTMSVAAFNVNFEHVSHLFLLFLLLTLSMHLSVGVSVWVCRGQFKKWESLEGYHNH